MNKTIYVISNNYTYDLSEFVKYCKEYIDKRCSNEILLKDGTNLVFYSSKDKYMDGIRIYYSYHEIFEMFLKRAKEDLQQQLEEKDIVEEVFTIWLTDKFNKTQDTTYLDVLMKYKKILERGKNANVAN